MTTFIKRVSKSSICSALLIASFMMAYAGAASAATQDGGRPTVTANPVAPVAGQLFPPGGLAGNDPSKGCPAGTALSWVGSGASGGAIQCVTLPVGASANTSCGSGQVMVGIVGGNASCTSTASLVGPTGPTGATGTNGLNGIAGPQGPTGPTGPAGSGASLACAGGQVFGYDSAGNPKCVGIPNGNPLFVTTLRINGWGNVARNPVDASHPAFKDQYGNTAPNVTAPYNDAAGTFNGTLDIAEDYYEHVSGWAPSVTYGENSCRVTDSAGDTNQAGRTISDVIQDSGCLTALCMGGNSGAQPLLAYSTGVCTTGVTGCNGLAVTISCMYSGQ